MSAADRPGRRQPTAYHLGRSGEVAGGMTQVLNGYLGWPFDTVTVSVITSRADPGDLLGSITNFARAAVTILRMNRRDPSVIVAHLSEGGSFLREGTLLRLARARGLGTISHLHGSSFAEFAAKRPWLVGPVLRASGRVISLSAESSTVSARFVSPQKVVLVPNAIPAGQPTEKLKTVVFGGVVSHRKGIDVLQAAWRATGSASAGWKLLIAGPIREPELVDTGLPNAEFLGSLPHSRLMGLLDSAQVAVLPSREEAMPMFILEAMARDVCVISTDVGGIAAVLGEGCGVVLPPGDVDALADALRHVLTDADAREALARSARARFDAEYSAESVFPFVEKVWIDAMGDSTHARNIGAL